MSTVENQYDAIKILIKAAQIAQSKGVFSLEEASTIHNAITLFIAKNDSEKTFDTKDNNNIDNIS